MIIGFDLRPIMNGNVSGVETYTRSLLSELLKLDKKNTYILYTNSGKVISHNIPKYTQKNVIYVHTSIQSKLFNLSCSYLRYPKIDSLIKKRTGLQVDVMFCPDPRPTPLNNARKITVVHDLCFKHFPEYFSRKSGIWFKYILNFERELKESTRIIAVSAYTRKDLHKTYRVPYDKIICIYEGAGEHLSLRGNLKKYKLPVNYFLMLSTMEPRKNTNNVVKAFKQANLKDITLVVAGKQNKKIFRDYHPITGKNILYPGFIEEGDKAQLLKHAKGFIYMSLFEGFGLPAIEAMYFKTPTLVSNTTSLFEIANRYALTADPQNIDDISEKLKLLAEHKQERPPYSWKKCAEETLNLITQL